MTDRPSRHLPRLAVALWLAGLLPILGCAIAAARISPSQANPWLHPLLFYSALALSFGGGVHWGFALDPNASAPPEGDAAKPRRPGLVIGILPLLIAWAGLALIAVSEELALALLIGGFIATLVVEEQGYRRGAVPFGFLWLRRVFTVVAVALLATVLVLRLIGARITF
ncbi:MAG: DUF3429 domain-containing protein [Acetobacteraceae bacterium]|nr:DUF3429 domain-containing protein [Acetobacteraceae bacterium]